MAEKPSILVVFAHPDDEAFPTGGTLAHYAALGHRVVLVCATKGEVGQLKAPALAPADGSPPDNGDNSHGRARASLQGAGH